MEEVRAGMEGGESACLVALSTFSLSPLPLWPGTQRRVIGIGIVEKVAVRVRIRTTMGCEVEGLEIVRRVARELEQIGMGF